MSHPAHSSSIQKAFASKKSRRAVDSLAYVVGIFGSLAVLPQVMAAWSSDAPGLAVMTWVLFTLTGLIWLIYAIQHKQRPLIIAQVVGISFNLAVISGWAVHNLPK
jgi:uncharacterized protein with PQ loop repeat